MRPKQFILTNLDNTNNFKTPVNLSPTKRNPDNLFIASKNEIQKFNKSPSLENTKVYDLKKMKEKLYLSPDQL